MATLRELVTVLSFEIDDKPLKQVEGRLNELKSTFSFAGLSIGAAAASLFGFAHFTAQAGDNALMTSQKLGITTQALQELQYAAKFGAEVGVDELRLSMQMLNRNLGEAMSGSKSAAKSFSDAGVNLAALKASGGGALQALGAIADRFKELQDPAQKSRLAVELFGRSGQALIPLLIDGSAGLAKLGARARELGVVMDDELIKNSELFDDTMEEALATMTGLRDMIGSGLVPVMTQLMKEFVAFASKERAKIASEISDVFKGMVKYIKLLSKFFGQLFRSAMGFVELAGGLERVATALALITAVIVSGQILMGIGRLTGAVLGLVKVFTLANAAALAIPLAVGAAMVAIGLVIEDVYGFFTGKDSLLGLIVEQMPGVADIFRSAFGPIFDSFSGMIYGIFGENGTWTMAVTNWAKTIGNIILAPFRALLNIMGAQPLIGKLFGGGMGGMADTIRQSFTGAADLLSFSPSMPTSPAMAAAQAAGMSSQSVQVDSPITVTVPPGTPPGEVGLRVQSGVSDGLEAVLRSTNRSFKGAPVY